MSLTMAQYQKDVDDWILGLGVKYFGPLSIMAQLAEEVGEVARLVVRIDGEQSFKAGAPEATNPEAHLADELADCIFVLTCLANQKGIDLTEALRRNIEKKTARDKERHANNVKLTKFTGTEG